MAGLQCTLGCQGGNCIEYGLEGGKAVSWGYVGKRVLIRKTSRSPKVTAFLCAWRTSGKLVRPGQMRTTGTWNWGHVVPWRATIFTFTLNDPGSHGKFLSRNMTWFLLSLRRICVKNGLLKGERAATVTQVRAAGGSLRLMSLFLAMDSDFRLPLQCVCVCVCTCTHMCTRTQCTRMCTHTQSYATLATPWTIDDRVPLFMGLTRQERWSGLPFPSPPFQFSCQRFHRDWEWNLVSPHDSHDGFCLLPAPPFATCFCSWTLDSTGLLLLTWWPQVISSLAVYLRHLKHTLSLLFHVSVQMSHVKEASLPRERKAPSSSFSWSPVCLLPYSHYSLPFYRLLNSLFLIRCWPLECKLCDRRAGSGLFCSKWNFQCPQEYLAELATWQMCSSTNEWMESPKV